MDPRAALLTEIEAFLSERAIAESTFGRLAVNDGKFVSRLRNQGNITWATAERVRSFIRANGSDATSTQHPASRSTNEVGA